MASGEQQVRQFHNFSKRYKHQYKLLCADWCLSQLDVNRRMSKAWPPRVLSSSSISFQCNASFCFSFLYTPSMTVLINNSAPVSQSLQILVQKQKRKLLRMNENSGNNCSAEEKPAVFVKCWPLSSVVLPSWAHRSSEQSTQVQTIAVAAEGCKQAAKSHIVRCKKSSI